MSLEAARVPAEFASTVILTEDVVSRTTFSCLSALHCHEAPLKTFVQQDTLGRRPQQFRCSARASRQVIYF